MSGSSENVDDVGLLAGLDRAALVAGGAEGGLEADALAGRGLLEVGDDLVVDDLGRRVGDERERRRALAGRGAAGGRVGRAAAGGHGHQSRATQHGEQQAGSGHAGALQRGCGTGQYPTKSVGKPGNK